MSDKIPAELKQIKQWTHSYSKEELKRPHHYLYEPNGGLPFNLADMVARQQDVLKGFYVTPEDDYVLGDVDHVEDPNNPWNVIPLELTMLLRSYPTYAEASPSGHGIRFIYRLPAGVKRELTGSYFLLKKELTNGGEYDPKGYQVNISKPWMTITGNATSFSADSIAEVPLDDLDSVFAIRRKETKQAEIQTKQVDIANLPAFVIIRTLLHTLPQDQNPRIKRAYRRTFNEDYEHYEYWLKVMMAIHNYATATGKDVECLHEFTLWSREDEIGYTSDEDVTKHWISLSEKSGNISYLSLIKLANEYRLRWPRPRKQSKAEAERHAPFKPLITEYANFKALVVYYDIKLYRDEDNPNILYVTGDSDIISQYFMMFRVEEHYGKYYGPYTKDTLTPALYVLAQDQGFIGCSHGQINQFVKTYLAETKETINLVKLYFDTPFRELPTKYRENEENYSRSDVDYLFEALEISYQTKHDRDKEDEMYKQYYRIWLMGLVRNLYFQEHHHSNNCVLLLTGPEQIRKTSHFKFLLPKFMRETYITLTPHGFANEGSMRDVTKLAASSLVLFWDEIERNLNADTESNFKQIIDGNPQKIIDKYEVIETTIVPKAIYGATSNLTEFKLGPEGSRRLFHIPVKWVDTDHMNTVNWHALINKLRDEIKYELRTGSTPWLLTKDQLAYQMELHKHIRAKTTVDIALDELFDADKKLKLYDGGELPLTGSIQTDKSGRLKTTREVSDTLARYGFGQLGFKRPALVKSLERFCGDYTGTRKLTINLSRPKCTIFKGLASQGPYKKWVMPPLRPEILEIFKSQFADIAGE